MTRIRPTDCSARVRCSRVIWEIATWVCVLLPSTAVLFSFLTDESIQLHVTSALVLGAIPAAVVLLMAAVLISLLSFLGTIYGLLRTTLAYAFGSCICLGTVFLVGIVNFHERDMYRVFVRVVGQRVRATTTMVLLTGNLLRRAAVGARNGWTFVVREMVLEASWAKQVARRLVEIMLFIAAWPIRTSARLLLRFINTSTSWSGLCRLPDWIRSRWCTDLVCYRTTG